MDTQPTNSDPVLANLAGLLPDLETLYKDVHAHPELSMQETRTAGIVAEYLRTAGFEVASGVGNTGVVGLLRNGDGPTVMLRADMDALPVAVGLDFERLGGGTPFARCLDWRERPRGLAAARGNVAAWPRGHRYCARCHERACASASDPDVNRRQPPRPTRAAVARPRGGCQRDEVRAD